MAVSDSRMSVSPDPRWSILVDRRAGRITLLGDYGDVDYVPAILDNEVSNETVGVWRTEAGWLVAAECRIASHDEDEMQQLSAIRDAVDRLEQVADADRAWFEPANLYRLIPFGDGGECSVVVYGSGRSKTAEQRAREADEAFAEALDQVRSNNRDGADDR